MALRWGEGGRHKPLKACEGSETVIHEGINELWNIVTNPSKPVKALKLSLVFYQNNYNGYDESQTPQSL